jgi:hypothetical protein
MLGKGSHDRAVTDESSQQCGRMWQRAGLEVNLLPQTSRSELRASRLHVRIGIPRGCSSLAPAVFLASTICQRWLYLQNTAAFSCAQASIAQSVARDAHGPSCRSRPGPARTCREAVVESSNRWWPGGSWNCEAHVMLGLQCKREAKSLPTNKSIAPRRYHA